jgi:hypothetical protein
MSYRKIYAGINEPPHPARGSRSTWASTVAIRAEVWEGLMGCPDWRYSSGQGCSLHETQKATPLPFQWARLHGPCRMWRLGALILPSWVPKTDRARWKCRALARYQIPGPYRVAIGVVAVARGLSPDALSPSSKQLA